MFSVASDSKRFVVYFVVVNSFPDVAVGKSINDSRLE